MSAFLKGCDSLHNYPEKHPRDANNFFFGLRKQRNLVICKDWMELQYIVSNEIIQTQKDKNHLTSPACEVWNK